MKKPFNWKVFIVVWAAGLFGAVAVLPYVLELQRMAGAPATPLTWQLLLLSVVQSAVMFGLATGIGLLCANRIGLGLPILEAALRGEPVGARLRAILPMSIVLGVFAGGLIIVLNAFVFAPALLAELGNEAAALAGPGAAPARWKAFFASFYGGISEEILLRLFMMSVLAWLGRFVFRSADGRPTLGVLWAANILAAVLFGLGHLPATAMLVPLTSLVILRAIVLNGLGGLIFGWLYMKRGLEAAMVSHFSADILLHVLFGI